jgi:hypothetical protein
MPGRSYDLGFVHTENLVIYCKNARRSVKRAPPGKEVGRHGCLSGTQWAKDIVRSVDGVQTNE